MLLNVNGFLTDEEMLGRARKRVLLDVDPGFGQMWQELGLHGMFRGHDDYVTLGRNIGRPDCAIPTCGLRWITMPLPVVLDHWPVYRAPPDAAFTSIASWRAPFGPIEYRGKVYGLRAHEFRKFARLPRLSNETFRLALRIHPDEVADLGLLAEGGWSLVDPLVVAGDPWAYRAFIQGSKAEFMVARSMYVETNSGWFSDRGIAYLASGKPVVAQDTGLRRLYPVGEGLLTFSTPAEALSAVDEVSRDYRRHARAARAIAEEYFDSDKVLGRLLGEVGIGKADRGRGR